LTGRENISLNGAILGMTRLEIQRKFDEIVAFAEIERFLDIQGRRYSAGMYVRLAFAVAAHLDAEILIVDEMLAVGDAEFQKKWKKLQIKFDAEPASLNPGFGFVISASDGTRALGANNHYQPSKKPAGLPTE
jgi:ABC-type polysaccharide/polyol phosphate transport system ATPase subunit